MASLTIYGPSGYLVLEIDPFGANSGYDSPPPIEQVVTRSRAVVVHPIPGREGNRKQDMGRDDDELTLSGIALGDDELHRRHGEQLEQWSALRDH